MGILRRVYFAWHSPKCFRWALPGAGDRSLFLWLFSPFQRRSYRLVWARDPLMCITVLRLGFAEWSWSRPVRRP